MRIFFLFVVFFGNTEFAQAQYIIPGASQQPAWVFPICVEDSFGRKDTVYIGYDDSATFFSCDDDSIYNEKYIFFDWQDTTKLTAFLCDHSFGGGVDSIKKIDVRNSLSGFDIWIHAGYFPITLRWDVSLLYSDSLLYPDQDPLPRAQGQIIWDYFPNEIQGCTDHYFPILVTDTCNNYYCCKRDSVVINPDGLNGSLGTSYVWFKFSPWTGEIPLTIEKISKIDFGPYPNPVHQGSQVHLNSNLEFNIAKIFNTYGKLIKTIKIFNNTIPITEIEKGIYFLILNYESENVNYKLIVY